MTKDQFKVFMAELAEVMSAYSSHPPDETMYRAMRSWLREKLVTREDGGE